MGSTGSSAGCAARPGVATCSHCSVSACRAARSRDTVCANGPVIVETAARRHVNVRPQCTIVPNSARSYAGIRTSSIGKRRPARRNDPSDTRGCIGRLGPARTNSTARAQRATCGQRAARVDRTATAIPSPSPAAANLASIVTSAGAARECGVFDRARVLRTIERAAR